MKNLNLKDFGAKPDGVFNNGEAFKTAFEEIAKNGGGKLTVDAGNWLTGPIDIPSDTTLELAEGAELSFLTDPNLYPPAFTRWEGVECYAMHALVRSSDTKNVKITGKGTLNGNGKSWWDLAHAKRNTQNSPIESYELALAKLNPG